jgi:hypothetical protein
MLKLLIGKTRNYYKNSGLKIARKETTEMENELLRVKCQRCSFCDSDKPVFPN